MNVSSKSNFSFKNESLKRNIFSKLSLNIRILLLVFVITLVIFYVFLFKSPNYSILYDNLSGDDEKSIVLRLTHLNIPFKFNKERTELLVPSNELQKVYFDLLEQGLPKEKKIGFELLDTEKFGLSQFNEQVNYQRALEGELARSMQRLDNVKTARVHIVLPKPSLFIRENKLPSASIILEVKPYCQLNYDQINSILYMVSRSISGLLVENITIVDQFGKLLSNVTDLYDSNNQLKYSNEIENHYKQRIENILIPLVGINNVHAQVAAQVNFDKQERSEEKYAPNYNSERQSVRSHQNKRNIEFNEKYMDNLVPSIDNTISNKLTNFKNLHISKKNLSKEHYINKFQDLSVVPQSSSNQDYIVNYELDHTISHNTLHVGNIKRLSVAVIINYIQDKHGKLVSLSKNKLNSIKKLVCESIGFSESRGDSISIANFKFVKKPEIHFVKSSHSFNWNISFLFDQLFKFLLVLMGLILLFVLNKKFSVSKVLSKKDERDNVSKEETFQGNLISKDDHDISKKETKFKNELNDILKSDSKKIAMIIRKWIGDEKS